MFAVSEDKVNDLHALLLFLVPPARLNPFVPTQWEGKADPGHAPLVTVLWLTLPGTGVTGDLAKK